MLPRKRLINCSICLVVLSLLLMAFVSKVDHSEFWGFYGHRLINRTAVFTLPAEMIPLYKGNIDFITKHSVDPDKRRYASPLEAVRHYIDLDHWGKYPFEDVPRELPEAMIQYGAFHLIEDSSGDTLTSWEERSDWKSFVSDYRERLLLHEIEFKLFEFMDDGYIDMPDSWIPDSVDLSDKKLVFTEQFTQYGILPYHLTLYQNRLKGAFQDRDIPLVIRLSTELGHYLSDAHVPLHTTENYNGQLTGQDGIHAFWESRIPELFAEAEYDFFVGKAQYIEEPEDFFWDIILESHTLVEEVLDRELNLRNSFSSDQQYCFDVRGGVTSRLECKEYARAYQDAMEGMVEDRMRKAILAIGSAWFTAWVDAGKPNLGVDLTAMENAPTSLLPDSLVIESDSLVHHLR